MSERRRVLVGTGYAFFGTIVALATAIVLRPVMVRVLGIAEYGVLAVGTTVVGIASIVADIGIASALTKFVASEATDKRRRELITSAMLLAFTLGMIPSGLLVVLAEPVAAAFLMPELGLLLSILAWQVPFAFAGVTGLSAINGLRWTRAYGAGSAFMSLTGFLTVFTALAVVGNLPSVGVAMVMAAIVNASALTFALRRFLVRPTAAMLRASLRSLGVFGIQMSATNAASSILYQADTAILGLVTKSDVQVGYYSIATLISRTLWYVPGSISIVAFPAVAEYARDKRSAAVESFITRAIRFSAALIGVGVVALAYFGLEIVTLLFGSDAAPALGLIGILAIGTAMLGVTKSVATGPASVGRPDVGLKVVVVGLVSSIGLNLLLVPTWGSLGAAFATATSFAVMSILLLWYLERTMKLRLDWKWLLVMVACIVALAAPSGFTTLLFPAQPWYRWFAGVLALSVLGWLLWWRLVPRVDWRIIGSTIRETISRARRG